MTPSTRSSHPGAPRQRGFTLVEMLVVVAMVAILGAVAYPSYLAQITKGRRADAKQALVELAQKLERYYTERGTYLGATLGSSGLYPTTSSGGYYTLDIGTPTADAFAITATPGGVQAGDVCSVLGYNQLGVQSVGSGASLTAAQCW